MNTNFDGWPHLLNEVIAGKTIEFEQAALVMSEVLEGRAASTQLAALLAVLRSRGETVEEMTGFASAMRSAAIGVPLKEEVRRAAVDTCGTGGDRSGTINISTTAAFVVAAAGVPVCKHGNRAASSVSGTADVLEALGARIDPGADNIAATVASAGFGFCLAPTFHPAMRFAMPVRRELGIPTAFNFLGPLVNPGRIERQVVGVSDWRKAELMLDVLAANGSTRAMVVFGNDGLDELTTTTTSVVFEWRDGEKRRYEVDATSFGLPRADPSMLTGGEPVFNAQRLRHVLEGEKHPQSDVVALNAAAGLIVGGLYDEFGDAVARAQEILASGAAIENLDAYVAGTNK